MPLFEEMCRRSINLDRDRILRESGLIKQMASYDINYASSESLLRQNMLFFNGSIVEWCRMIQLWVDRKRK